MCIHVKVLFDNAFMFLYEMFLRKLIEINVLIEVLVSSQIFFIKNKVKVFYKELKNKNFWLESVF